MNIIGGKITLRMLNSIVVYFKVQQFWTPGNRAQKLIGQENLFYKQAVLVFKTLPYEIKVKHLSKHMIGKLTEHECWKYTLLWNT